MCPGITRYIGTLLSSMLPWRDEEEEGWFCNGIESDTRRVAGYVCVCVICMYVLKILFFEDAEGVVFVLSGDV